MKITEDYIDTSPEELEVTLAEYSGDYKIIILFNNGTKKEVDFKPFLENSAHPSIRKYLNESSFKNYKIIDGNLNWNDYDLIFPLDDLYEGNIDRKG